jgi:FkbM family methyltransferase
VNVIRSAFRRVRRARLGGRGRDDQGHPDPRTALAFAEKPPRDLTISPVAAAIFGALSCSTRVQPLRIVQIGANPSLADPIQPHFAAFGVHVKLLLIEAHPAAFLRLADVFGNDPRVSLEHAFVGTEGDRLFALDPDLEEEYLARRRRPADRISSGLYEHVSERIARRLGLEGDELSRAIVELDVPVRPLACICDDAGFTTFDVLQIDAEGKDLEILNSVDLVARGVRIVNFESTADARIEHEEIERLKSLGFIHVDGEHGAGDILLVRPL